MRQRDPFGPITPSQARRRLIRYGPLTARQFDDLERVSLLNVASCFDLATATRTPESVVRVMNTYARMGLVERVFDECSRHDAPEWRMTQRGRHWLEVAFHHMDRIVAELDDPEGDWYA